MSAMERAARTIGALVRSEHAAIAPLTALALVGLVTAGGLAFDYSRMVSLDTELQDAADHAALAAASQLDREADQCTRATAHATALVANDTRFATDGGGSLVTIDNVACNDDLRRVDVTVTARTVDFTLTPLMGLFNATLQATAAASIGSAICKVPPLMMCNPGELSGDPAFTIANYIGKGIELVGGGGSTWAPGNFGFLDVGGLDAGTPDQAIAMGTVSPELPCVSEDGVDTNPGLSTSVFGAFNTRFDIYDGWGKTQCSHDSPDCPSDMNVVKDVVRNRMAASAGSCDFETGGGGQGWRLLSAPENYLPSAATRTDADGAAVMGHPRDICHAVSTAGDCANGPIGDGNWDRELYFQTNHGVANPLGAGVTRWAVYNWEKSGQMPDPIDVGARRAYSGPQCSAGYGGAPERRKVSMAIINCQAEGVRGHATNVSVIEWADIFLVEPALNRPRTSGSEIYVEIIGKSQTATAGYGGQIVRRDLPYLIE